MYGVQMISAHRRLLNRRLSGSHLEPRLVLGNILSYDGSAGMKNPLRTRVRYGGILSRQDGWKTVPLEAGRNVPRVSMLNHVRNTELGSGAGITASFENREGRGREKLLRLANIARGLRTGQEWHILPTLRLRDVGQIQYSVCCIHKYFGYLCAVNFQY